MSNNDILRHLRLLFLNEDGDANHQPVTHFFPAIIYVQYLENQKLTYLNQHRISEYLGFSIEEMESWQGGFMNLVFNDDKELVMQELEKYHLLQDDEDYSYNSRLNHKEGDWRYFRTRGTVLRRNEEGNPLSFLFIAEDVTQKTKSEEEVIALKKIIDETEELLNFGSWSWDLQVDKVNWTDGMFKILNYQKPDVEAIVSTEFYLTHLMEKDASVLIDVMKSSIAKKSDFEYKHNITTNTKEEKIVSTKGRTITNANGEVIKLVGITRDITKQTKINRDLFHYKEMIKEKEKFLNQGSWETNIGNGETTWSKGMYRLFGYDSETELKKTEITNELHFSHVSEEELRRSKEDWKKILRDQDNYAREITITTKVGITRKLETYGKVIRNNQGIAEKVIGTTRDVTRLREYERSLEEKIQELNRSNSELEDFAYVASHDLQEPLRKLTTFSERLQLKFKEALGDEGSLYLNRIVAATENMRILIDNLLEFSRTARSSKHFAKIDLNFLLEEVKAELELKIEETGTQISSSLLPVIEVIPSQIKQLFINLLSNSIKFKKTEINSIIAITCNRLGAKEKSQYNLRTEKNYFKIEIADNGIGFEREYAERIFQIFQRLHGKAEYPGSGIGLAICKKIVENHNGFIFASAYPDQGAMFNVILPENQSI